MTDHPLTDAPPADLEALGRSLLLAIGEDPDREGLRETPARWARWWQEFIAYQPGNTDTVFEAVQTDQMVVVSGIEVWSLCEHHLLPFRCHVAVGYITHQKVLGLSKFARIAHAAAHKLQLQERLVAEIADEIERLTGSADVAVLADGLHLCMAMRGIRSPATMTTSVMRGKYRALAEVRAEFLNLIQRRDPWG